MLIHFSNVNFSSRTGPNSFATRLATQLTSLGHEIVSASEEYDAALVFIEPSSKLKPTARIVQRLDGIWFKPEQFVSHNVRIKALYDTADHVVWQTEFDKSMTTHHWGDRKGSVILNGVPLQKVEPVRRAGFLEGSPLFVCASNWHPQKRLSENIALFRHIKNTVSLHHNARLVIMGKCDTNSLDDSNFGDDIAFLGDADHKTCARLYATADWMIHLAWLDHCPNVVVEALSQGCPVICTDSGGTKEIVRHRGIVIPEQKYNYELTDYDNPPIVDLTHITNLIKPVFSVDDLDIKSVAEKYIEVLRK